jgi:plasmid replication initiation protein
MTAPAYVLSADDLIWSQARTTAAPELVPDRYPNRDFFIAGLVDWALKDDRHTMEHPFFSLSKKADHKTRHYEHKGCNVTIEPGKHGLATIWDKDILLYAISQLVETLNQGRPINRTVQLKAYNFLVATNRSTGGRSYKLLKGSFRRLAGTRIETNIASNGLRFHEGFGLIDNWRILERTADGHMVAVEVTLNEWLFNAIKAREVLTLDREYFRLDGGLERRLYELARKHCGLQPKWTVGVELLHKKSGSTSPMKQFRHKIKQIGDKNILPRYTLRYESEGDQVMFHVKSFGTSETTPSPSLG